MENKWTITEKEKDNFIDNLTNEEILEFWKESNKLAEENNIRLEYIKLYVAIQDNWKPT